MSGPKISVYTLTEQAKAIIAGQLRCERQSLACYARTQGMIREAHIALEDFDRQIRNVQLLMKRRFEGPGQIEKLQSLQKTMQLEAAEIERELTENTPYISERHSISEESYAEKRVVLQRLQMLQKRAEKLKAELDAAFEGDEKNASGAQTHILHDMDALNAGEPGDIPMASLRHSDAHNIQRIRESILEDLNGVYSFALDDEAPDTTFQDKKAGIRDKLLEPLRDNALPEALRSEIKRALSLLQSIESMQYLRSFDAVIVAGIFRRIDVCKREAEQREAAYEASFSQYAALCSMAGEPAEQMPFSEEALALVHAQIERLEQLLARRREQSYISECVDAVMEDMGYDLVGSREVRKKSGKQFRNELFTFQDGTAVNVTFSSDGQISMELGGLAREDRLPTAKETERLVRDMEHFCGEFAEFERRMLAKGVVVGNRIALSPPTAAYAAIINVDDYDIDESTQLSMMRVTEKEHKQAERKAARRYE